MVEAVFRVRRTIERLGEAYLIGVSERKALVATLTPTEARRYVSQSVIDGSNRPIYVFLIRDDDSLSLSDTITYHSLSLSVLSILPRYLRGAVVCKMVLAA